MSFILSPLQAGIDKIVKGQGSGRIGVLFVPSQGMTGTLAITMYHLKDMPTGHVSVSQLLQQKRQANPEGFLSQDL